ncbi:MAG: NAD(P)-binding protein [Sphingomonas sp.]
MSEILILGGGIAGGAAAVLAARAGLPVSLLERETGPSDKMCGEFLSIEAQQHLQALGIDTGRARRRAGRSCAADRARAHGGGPAAVPRIGPEPPLPRRSRAGAGRAGRRPDRGAASR